MPEKMSAIYSQKELLKIENEKAFHAFKLSSNKEYTEHIAAWLPNRLFSNNSKTYKKIRHSVGGSTVDFIEKNGQFHSLLWHATPENVYQAVRWGIYKPQALSAQAIATIGAYQCKTLERAYRDGIVSNRYEEKKQLVAITLDRIEALQQLESLINNYDANALPIQNYQKIKQTFSDYIMQLEERRQKIIDRTKTLINYDYKATDKIIQFIDKDILSATAYQNWLESCKSNKRITEPFIHNHILAPLGSSSLFSWMKRRIISATKQCQEINQNLSYGTSKIKKNTRALLRGDLNSIIEDTLKTVNTYNPDLHNRILPEHQGHFFLEKGKKCLTLDFSFNQGNYEANCQALMAICHIEEVDSIQRFTEDGAGYYLVTPEAKEGPIALKETAYTKWARQDLGKLQVVQRLLKGACNIATGIIFGLTFDLVWGLIGGIGHSLLHAFAYKPDHWGYSFFSFSLAEKLKFASETLSSSKTKFAELLERIPSRKLPLGRKFAQK